MLSGEVLASMVIFLSLAIAKPMLVPALPGSLTPPVNPDGDDGKFHWASIGDSWASGVRYNSSNWYDDDAFCRRIIHAYSAQMEKNTTWTKDSQQFSFEACSGSRLSHMAKDQQNGKGPQIDLVESPQLVVMTAGGNNGGVFSIASNCIFHQDWSKDYGPPYEKDPNHQGLCAKAIDQTLAYIEDTSSGSGLGFDLRVTIDDTLNNDHTKQHKQFFLYVTGYVHFWNVDVPDSNYCNTCRFSVNPWFFSTLNIELRVAMNDLVQKFNECYATTINAYRPRAGATVRFVDVSPNFNRHRFCEPEDDCLGLFSSEVSHIFPLSAQTDGETTEAGDAQTVCENGCVLWDFSTPDDDQHSSSDGLQTRVFHPKAFGHNGISQHLYSRFQEDKLPGTVWE